MRPHQHAVPVVESSQVGAARRTAVRAADELGLSESRRGDVALIVTEMATNLVRHAQQGMVLIQTLHSPAGACLELLSIDRGPGMADPQKCLQDGYSTGGTAGTGLGAVRRLADEFDLESRAGAGTVLLARVHAPGFDRRAAAFDVGAISIPVRGETECGDTWRAVQRDQELAVMVADGLGHGPAAAAAADRAREIFDEDPFVPAEAFFARAHRALSGTRGAALARAHVGGPTGVDYASVGNINAALLGGGQSRGLPFQNGTVGLQTLRRVDRVSHNWPADGVLVLHSDGLIGRWNVNRYPSLQARHPAVVAGVLYRDFLRGRDDATVVVARRRAAMEVR